MIYGLGVGVWGWVPYIYTHTEPQPQPQTIYHPISKINYQFLTLS